EEFEPEAMELGSTFTTKALPGVKGISIIIGIPKGEVTTSAQAYRFDADLYTPAQAKKWMKDHGKDYIDFEAAENPCGGCRDNTRYPECGETCELNPGSAEKDNPNNPRRTITHYVVISEEDGLYWLHIFMDGKIIDSISFKTLKEARKAAEEVVPLLSKATGEPFSIIDGGRTVAIVYPDRTKRINPDNPDHGSVENPADNKNIIEGWSKNLTDALVGNAALIKSKAQMKGFLGALYTFRANFRPGAYYRDKGVEETQKQIWRAISIIENNLTKAGRLKKSALKEI
ncbi:MAG: hypothetical protein GTN53_16430, partial [Candidatus Aminicenantes bacterium]|nr:hypothetical protein [Candidatus Aminicenantes bacterium]NIQ68043.1 hypothetical protein [Candidatus Aminicenantes bacterium]NIT24082.1 hypothetical protein [Candidatus Aminicenantes bacterium]